MRSLSANLCHFAWEDQRIHSYFIKQVPPAHACIAVCIDPAKYLKLQT